MFACARTYVNINGGVVFGICPVGYSDITAAYNGSNFIPAITDCKVCDINRTILTLHIGTYINITLNVGIVRACS